MVSQHRNGERNGETWKIAYRDWKPSITMERGTWNNTGMPFLFIEDHTSRFFVQTKWLTTERVNKKIPAYHHFVSNTVLID
jgi:hypothetical protein